MLFIALLLGPALGLVPPRAVRTAPRTAPVSMAANLPEANDAKALLISLAARGMAEEEKDAALRQLMTSETRDATLDSALELIDEAASASLFARRRWPLPLPSRRAKVCIP